MAEKTRVAVIFGGRSSEHEISCISAGSVLRAIDRSRYDVVPIGITHTGSWVLEADDSDRLQVRNGVFPQVDESRPLAVFPDVLADVDVAFPVLHGPFGEDGTIQGFLEMADVPYVGSGVFASAACMDKAHMKSMLSAAGLPIGKYEVITDFQWNKDKPAALKRVESLGFPVFVKPSRAGSSVGISKVKSADELEAAIVAAQAHDPKVIIEASIENAHEIECGVLGSADGPQASVIAEIVVREGHEFYDYEAKYVDDSVDLVVPANLPTEISDRVRELAAQAFAALDCEGLARVDVFVQGEKIFINEINTMPGFTPISMFPRMWNETGKSYPELVDYLVQDALRRGTGLR